MTHFADDNFELDENSIKFSNRVENTMEKGEIACYEQFLLFPQCFQKTCTADMLKPGPVWERANYRPPLKKRWILLVCLSVCPSVHL